MVQSELSAARASTTSMIDDNTKCARCQRCKPPRELLGGLCHGCTVAALAESEQKRAGMLYRFGNLFAELTYAITGTHEALTDAQLVATARRVRRDAEALWRRQEAAMRELKDVTCQE